MADFGWFGTQVAKVVTATLLGGFIGDLQVVTGYKHLIFELQARCLG